MHRTSKPSCGQWPLASSAPGPSTRGQASSFQHLDKALQGFPKKRAAGGGGGVSLSPLPIPEPALGSEGSRGSAQSEQTDVALAPGGRGHWVGLGCLGVSQPIL